jgi:hypothetical protein
MEQQMQQPVRSMQQPMQQPMQQSTYKPAQPVQEKSWMSRHPWISAGIAIFILAVIYMMYFSGGSAEEAPATGGGGPISMATGLLATTVGGTVAGIKGIATVVKSKPVAKAANTVAKGTVNKVANPLAKSAKNTGKSIKGAFKKMKI